MFDYYAAIRKANAITGEASNLRVQASKLNSLLNIVGGDYAGKDADAYYKAVKSAQDELYSLASYLDSISTKIKRTAKTVQNEENED